MKLAKKSPNNYKKRSISILFLPILQWKVSKNNTFLSKNKKTSTEFMLFFSPSNFQPFIFFREIEKKFLLIYLKIWMWFHGKNPIFFSNRRKPTQSISAEIYNQSSGKCRRRLLKKEGPNRLHIAAAQYRGRGRKAWKSSALGRSRRLYWPRPD